MTVQEQSWCKHAGAFRTIGILLVVPASWKIAAHKNVGEACSFARNLQNRPAEITEVFAVPLVGKRCKLEERSNLEDLASLDDRRLRCEPST